MGKINQTAVDNFLGSLDMSIPMEAHIQNALSDALSYGWNVATLDAIIVGIGEKYRPHGDKE
jgi:hypothetical protein